MKITVRIPRPRNPLVAAARVRKAGTHRRSHKSARRREARLLAHEIQKMTDTTD